MIEEEKRESINLNANYLKPIFLAMIIQVSILILLGIFAIIDLLIELVDLLSTLNPDSFNFPYLRTYGIIFMVAGFLLLMLPFLFFGYKATKIKKQEEVDEFNEFGKKLFWDRGGLSWIFFLGGLIIFIIGFF